MKNFRGRIPRPSGGHYNYYDDSEDSSGSEWDEVEAVYTAGNFELFVDGDLVEDDTELSDSSDGSSGEEEFGVLHFGRAVEDELEEENIALEGYFAFGGRLRSRRWRGSQDSFELSFPPRSPPPLDGEERREEGEEERSGSEEEEGFNHRHPDTPTPIWDGRSTPDKDRLEFSSESEGEEIISRTPSPSGRSQAPHPRQRRRGRAHSTANNTTDAMGSVDPGASSSTTNASTSTSSSSSTSTSTSNATGDSSKCSKAKDELDANGGGSKGRKGEDKTLENISEEGTREKFDDAVSESGSGRTVTDEISETCNPMVSDAEEFDENDDALRGDRIGATTYSERHVLKILIKWVQELPKYSEDSVKGQETESTSSTPIDKTRFLEPDFEEEMALLWDMSFEPDVMNFLVQQNIFNIIRDTIEQSRCARLTEVGLGIMANIISQQSILEDFSIHDASLRLVEGMITLVVKMPSVPVLIQVFAVLRRITWFLRHVAHVQKWMDLLISPAFLNCANFILSSSTNALLLGNVIITLFSILETLSPDTEKEADRDDTNDPSDEDEPSASTSTISPTKNYFGMQEKNDFVTVHFRPFCETGFVQSLCEGLAELMKNPKPRRVQKLTSTRDRESYPDDATDSTAFLDELPVPDGLVQNAIIYGLSSFYILYKTMNGKEAIREHHQAVVGFLLSFFSKFSLCTDSLSSSSCLDYYAIAINLLSFCHKEFGELSTEGISVPLATASKLMEGEQEEEETRYQIKDGAEHDSKTFIALVVHEYLAGLADVFGTEKISLVKSSLKGNKNKSFFEAVDKLVNNVSAKGKDGS